jgi:hypothetical protein
MTWEAFKTKLRKAHIPSGLIKIMRDKFLNLKQGGMSVTEYLDKFTTWGRYAPNDIDTDKKKRELFLKGLQEELQTYLVAVPYNDLEALVDAAIMVEDKNKAACESRKRRMMSQGGPSSQRSRSMPPSRTAPPPQRFAPPYPNLHGVTRPTQRHRCPAPSSTHATGPSLKLTIARLKPPPLRPNWPATDATHPTPRLSLWCRPREPPMVPNHFR